MASWSWPGARTVTCRVLVSASPSPTTSVAPESPASGAPSTSAATTGATAGEVTTPPQSTTEAPATTVRPRPDGEPAPDFALELALGEGGLFILSEEQKPVYMVFWADW